MSGSSSDTGAGGDGGATGRSPRPLRDEDNPFMRQLQLMLDKSASNRAAAVSPSLPRAAGGAAPASAAWRPTALSGGSGSVGSGAGSLEGAAGSRASQVGQPLSAQPKEAANDADRNSKVSRSFSPPRSLMDLLDSSSSDDEAFRRRAFGSAPAKEKLPSPVAERKASPSSDGGWPETKRCSPPNLKASSSSSSSARSPGITGNRPHGGAGITGLRPPSQISSGRESGVAGGEGISGARAPSMHGRSVAATPAAAAAGSDNEWMSDAEDQDGPACTASSSGPATAEATARPSGLKRGRTPPRGGGSGHASDGSSGSGGDARGRKTGRLSERYPTPVPSRKQRSNSLSLSPPRLLACDSDYVTSEEEETQAISTSGVLGAGARPAGRKGTARDRGGGGGGGGKKELPLSSAATARRRRPGAAAAATEDGDGRGRKRGHEDLLNDRIEALRVGSDGEEPQVSGGGKGKRRGGRVDPMAADDNEEEEEDDEVDYEDRRPRFDDPPWLGKLEPFDLGGGGFINPSINRYLRGYQREGVRASVCVCVCACLCAILCACLRACVLRGRGFRAVLVFDVFAD